MDRNPLIRLGYRVGIIVVLVFLATTLALRLYGRYKLAQAEELVTRTFGDVTAESLALPPLPDDQNAAIPLGAGARALILSQEEKEIIALLTMKSANTWTEEERARLKGILAKNAPGLELLHRATTLHSANFGLSPTKPSIEKDRDSMHPILEFVWAARLLCDDARLAWSDGDKGRFLSSQGALSVLASSLEGETDGVAQLIGLAVERFALRGVYEALADPTVDRVTLQELDAMMSTTDLGASFRRGQAARVVVMRQVRSLPSSYAPDTKKKAGIIKKLYWWVVDDAVEADSIAYPARLLSLVEDPYAHWSDASDEINDGLLSFLHPFASIEFPSLRNSAGRFQVAMAQRRLARLAIALRLHFLQHGAYPIDLSAWPAALGPDPFTDQPLSYQVRTDGSALLGIEDGERLWKKLTDGMAIAIPFVWELPAPQLVKGGARQ